MLLLGFFEVPSWCYDSSDCGDPRVVPQSGIPQFTIGAGLLMEFLILITLLIFLSLNFWTLRFTSWKSSVVEVVLIVVSILDVLISSFVTRNIRLSPFLRPLIFISISTTVRNSLKSIFYGTRAILHLLFLLFFWIFFMASIATVLFKHTSSFATLKEAFLQLIILITTANFPDVAIGALKESIFSIFFFAIFVSLGIWFLMNIVLATIYSSYKTRLEKEQSNEKNKQIYCLKKAFLELHSIRKTGFINYREMMALFRELNVYVHIPSIYTDHQKFILSTMDTKKNGHISGFEFLKLVDLMHIRLREQKSLSFLQILFPSFTTSKFYLLISRMVNHRSFGRVVDLIQAINLVLIGVEWIIHSSQLVFVDNTILIVIFNLEVIMKMLAIGGFTEYINKGRNIYIFLITVSSNVVFCSPDYFDDEIMLLQMLRLSRIFILFLHFPSYNTLASTFQSLLPQLLNLVYVVFMIDYLFCLIGIALYGGEMNMNNHKLNGTLFLASEYTVLNFNDLFSGYVTLFTLRVVNNWYIIMEGYVSISHELSRVYFIGYWLIGAVIILSVVVSSILEKFLSELEHRENHSHRKVNRQLFPPERSWDEIAQNLK
uniref:EF-hand domain-containing protein n=1 Tax=Arcella intermedia TaxID=1963864 RepID=A0A6B2L028_9EUKA